MFSRDDRTVGRMDGGINEKGRLDHWIIELLYTMAPVTFQRSTTVCIDLVLVQEAKTKKLNRFVGSHSSDAREGVIDGSFLFLI